MKKIYLSVLLFAIIFIAKYFPAFAQQSTGSIQFSDFYPITYAPPSSPSPTVISVISDTPAPNLSTTPNLTISPTQIINPSITLTPSAPTPTPKPGKKDCQVVADEAKEIANSLSPGFWNYYNKSSLYPELWDKNYFKNYPNACLDTPANTYPEDCIGDYPPPEALFWCTWMTMKSYERAGFDIPQDLWGVSDQKTWFKGRGRYLLGDSKIDKVPAGSAIIFRYGTSDRPRHVAVITEITQDKITIHESNSNKTYRSFTISEDRKIQSPDPENIIIDGFGLPPKDCD